MYEVAFSHEIFRNATPDQASLAAHFCITWTAQCFMGRWPDSFALTLSSRTSSPCTRRVQTAKWMPESSASTMLPVRSESCNHLRQLVCKSRYYSAAMKKIWWRGLIEVGFIIFLFYSNLLMGEFERTGWGSQRGVGWALWDTFTFANLGIGMVAAMIGYILFEFLRTKF
jgi:hypothetical protein